MVKKVTVNFKNENFPLQVISLRNRFGSLSF